MCDDEPDYSDQLENYEEVCDTDDATANIDATTSRVDDDTFLPVDAHGVSYYRSDPTDNEIVDTG